MATIESDIETALFVRVAALVLSPALPIAWPNVSFTKPSTGYLRVSQLPNDNVRLFIGSNDPHLRFGLLQVDVYQPLNKGASAATEIAGKIAEWFPTDFPMRAGGVTVKVERAPSVGRAAPDTTHWMIPVTVRYECFA